jgi:alpha-glucosidase
VSSWLDSAVVYEIYPRSFQDSDGDGSGDLAGIESRLPYLADLGVDAVWLTPFYPSPLADWGYDVSDHRAVAPEFGTLDDFDALVAAAHGLGIKVMLDLVVSHTSIEHPWFRERPDFYVWADGPEPPNSWIASFGGPAWSRDERTGRLYLHSFYPEQPDLDWRNPEVREAMGEVIRFWAGRGVDGFRVDAVDRLMKDPGLADDPPGARPFPLLVHPDQQHLDLVNSRDAPDIELALGALREAAGELPMVGEVYLPADRVERYLGYFERTFSFDLLHSRWNAEELAAAIEAGRSGRPAWVVSNHDFVRVATRWGEANARAAAVLLLTLDGPAFVYQGEELGLVEGPGGSPPRDRYGRDGCRHPMQWSEEPGGGFSSGEPWLPPVDPELRSVASQDGDPGSMLTLFRQLIELRRTLTGAATVLTAAGGVLVYARGEEAVVVNTSSQTAPLPECARGRPVLLATSGEALDSRTGSIAGSAAAVLGRMTDTVV